VTYYGETVVAIPGATRPEQAAAVAVAMDLQLTEAEMARLDELSAQVAKR
jgi:diketogulonate reductase-like aldo/keto reductase